MSFLYTAFSTKDIIAFAVEAVAKGVPCVGGGSGVHEGTGGERGGWSKSCEDECTVLLCP